MRSTVNTPNRRLRRPYGKELHKQRNGIKRCFAHRKQLRRLTTPYGKDQPRFRALVSPAYSALGLHSIVDTA